MEENACWWIDSGLGRNRWVLCRRKTVLIKRLAEGDMAENRHTDNESRERIIVLETQMNAILEQHKQMGHDIRIILNTLAEA